MRGFGLTVAHLAAAKVRLAAQHQMVSSVQAQWVSRNFFGLGQAEVTCENGQTGRVLYTYQDEHTGTAVGQGSMHSGEKIKIWSGTNVLEYLRGDTGELIAYLPCSGGPILMG